MQRSERRKERCREGGGGTDHSAISDEPDACCYADRREENRKRKRKRERSGEAKCGHQLGLNSPLTGQSDRQARGRCERSRVPWNASRRMKNWRKKKKRG